MPRSFPPARRALLIAVALGAALPGDGGAQIQASEKATLSQVISGTTVEIEYYRPSVRGRSPVFGGIVPWGEVWTPGANWSTKLRVSKDVELNGVTVPAGVYGLWIELHETGPWTLVVHADTTLFHTDHPEVEEGLLAIPVDRVPSPDFVETLTFTLDGVRPTGAELRLTWGDVRVPIRLGVDPGIETDVAPEAFARFSGAWLYDDAPALPTEEKLAEWRATLPAEQLRGFEEYFEGLRGMTRPRLIRFDRDPATGTVRMVDPEADALFAAMDGAGSTDWGMILLPRGEGVYAQALAIGGELATFDPAFAPLVEFEFGPGGTAVRLTTRDGDDAITGTGVRPGS